MDVILARTLVCTAMLTTLFACRRDAPSEAPRTREAALRQLALCTFDGLGPEPDAMRVEAAIRQALRRDRMAFAERAGQCESAISDELRTHDPAMRTLDEAWSALRSAAQTNPADQIALERAVRHIGNAWRTVARR